MVKGARSVNAAGRSRGFAGVAKQIMTHMRDGDELIEYALNVFRDPVADPRDRQWAHGWLSDRALGKPLQSMDLTAQLIASEPAQADEDLSGLSIEQMRELLELENKRDALLAKAADATSAPTVLMLEASNSDA